MRWEPKPAIADQIIEQEGEYVLALKENQGNLYEEVQATFVLALQEAEVAGHTESERRALEGTWSARNTGVVDHQRSGDRERISTQRRGGMACEGFPMVRAERRLEQEITRETRYFLLSFP